MKNINVVIIGLNEGWIAELTIHSLLKFFNPEQIIYVLDRCSDNTLLIVKKIGIRYVETPISWNGRKTSSARNLGLKMCDKNHDVLFLDGDRSIVEGNLNDLYKEQSDVIWIGLENDVRTYDNFQLNYGKVHNGCFSCGVLFKRSAINKIIEFQGELFPTKLEYVWGIEDTSLGDVCYHLGLKSIFCESIKLRGEFSRFNLDSLDALELRFKFRDNLNVRWD